MDVKRNYYLLALSDRAEPNRSLSLSYNSLVWTKNGDTLKFNADRGFPGSGFRIGFPTQSKDRNDNYVTIGYDSYGHIVNATDKLGRDTHSFILESGADYIAADTKYDALGRVCMVSNPYRTQSLSGTVANANDCTAASSWTTSTYDPLGRVKQITLPDLTIVQNIYQGIYTTVTDQAGKQRRQKVDVLGRVVRVDEPDASGQLGAVDTPAQATSYSYDTLGNLVHITQGAGQNTQHRYFKYDALSRLTYEAQVEQTPAFNLSDPLTGNTQWTRRLVYDENSYQGLMTSQYDARQIHTQFAYDRLDRISQVSYSDGTPTVNNYYDQARTGYFNKGHLTQAITAAVAASGQVAAIPETSAVYDFDLMGRVKRQQQMLEWNPATLSYNYNYTLGYSYSLGGQLSSETYPSGRVVNYSYDDAARLANVTSGGTTYLSQFVYGPKGTVSSVTFGNGAIESYDYNDRLQVREQSLAKDGATIQRYVYKYGQANLGTGAVDETKNNGQLGSIESYIGTRQQWQQRFTYDSLGRLSAAGEYRGDNSQQSYLLAYDYDSFGNRYQKQTHNQANPFSPVWVEDADVNQLTNRLASGVTYDAAGNLTQDTKFRSLQFQYDANNRQRWSAITDGTGALTAIYDGAGQRVGTKAGGALSVSVYDAFGKLVAEYGQASPATGGTQYVFSDTQRTPRVLTTPGGSVLSRHDYQPFGEELSASVGLRTSTQGYGAGDGVRQKYAGMEGDDSGLSHTLWRQYDDKSGRWTAPDPYSGSMTVGNPQSFNRYSYVNNDPVNHVDLLGLMLYDIGVYRTENPQGLA